MVTLPDERITGNNLRDHPVYWEEVMNILKNLASASALALVATGALAQDVTIRVWDTFADQTDGMQAFVAAFEAANPGIKVARDVQSIDEMRPVIQTALNAGTGPDIFYYDTGPAFAGVLADAGLLLPIDDMYENGMLDAVYPWTRERVTFGDVTYGIGNEVEFLGVYYNREIFTDLGLEVPTTHEEFAAVAQALQDAGNVPIAFGDADGWPAFHIFSLYANNIVGKEGLEAMIAGERSWDDPKVVASIEPFFVAMNEAGYLAPSVNAVNYDDSINLFTAGLSGMMVTGTWLIQSMTDSGLDVGWFFLPAPEGMDTLPPAGLGSGYFVSAATEHPEETEKFLEFLFDPANASYWVEGMSVVPPYAVDTAGMEVAPLTSFAMDALATVPMGYNIDVLTPDAFNNTMKDGFQAVLGGDRTSAEQAAALAASVE
jgi:raffinose/stachyose/melibiose transport system substrate-binding protein